RSPRQPGGPRLGVDPPPEPVPQVPAGRAADGDQGRGVNRRRREPLAPLHHSAPPLSRVSFVHRRIFTPSTVISPSGTASSRNGKSRPTFSAVSTISISTGSSVM